MGYQKRKGKIRFLVAVVSYFINQKNINLTYEEAAIPKKTFSS